MCVLRKLICAKGKKFSMLEAKQWEYEYSSEFDKRQSSFVKFARKTISKTEFCKQNLSRENFDIFQIYELEWVVFVWCSFQNLDQAWNTDCRKLWALNFGFGRGSRFCIRKFNKWEILYYLLPRIFKIGSVNGTFQIWI